VLHGLEAGLALPKSEIVLQVVQIRADSFVLGKGRQRELGDYQSNARGVRELEYFAEGRGSAAALQEQIALISGHKEEVPEIWTRLPLRLSTDLGSLLRPTRLCGFGRRWRCRPRVRPLRPLGN
jgi:hypothetical protein